MARVTLTPDAAEKFDRLPKAIRTRMLRLFERLAGWPDVSGARPLAGELAGHYRMRTGDYRLIFRVEGDQAIVVKLGHRKEIYEG